ncbi:MAG: hypothetical protein VZR10_06350 [Methanobrevibacter sp.]|nr:hypothetical protein [Methanobrevibacter sp.]
MINALFITHRVAHDFVNSQFKVKEHAEEGFKHSFFQMAGGLSGFRQAAGFKAVHACDFNSVAYGE